MLVCPTPEHLEVPTPRGFATTAGTWQCDVERYERFLESVGGQDAPIECDGTCYVVGSRIEGFIEQRQANGEWTPALVETLPDVESLAEIEALALFFRTCQAEREQGTASVPGEPPV
jgi:hypothetical protein